MRFEVHRPHFRALSYVLLHFALPNKVLRIDVPAVISKVIFLGIWLCQHSVKP